MHNSIIAKLKRKGIRLKTLAHRQAVVELEDEGRYVLRISRAIKTCRKYKTIKKGEERRYLYDYFILNLTAIPDDVDGALVVFLGENDRIEKVATVSKFTNIIKRTMIVRDSLDGYAESVLFDIDGFDWGQQEI